MTTTPCSTKMLTAALDLAHGGFPVFPCVPNDKKPMTPTGFKDATTDEAKIRSWWTKTPDANLAMPMGVEAGLVVIDIDYDVEKGLDGEASWEALVADQEVPPTSEVHTPRGGRHLYFRHPGGEVRIQCSTSKIAKGVDVRGDGGYIVMPPSRTAIGEYVVTNDAAPAEIPNWLLTLLCQKEMPKAALPAISTRPPSSNYGRTALSVETLAVRHAAPGTRNARLNSAAFSLGQLVGGEILDRADVEASLLEAGRAAGLPDSECRSTIASGINKGVTQPRNTVPYAGSTGRPPVHRNDVIPRITGVTVPTKAPEEWLELIPLAGLSTPPPPFPVDALPPPLAAMVQAIGETMNVPFELPAAAVLGVASTAIGNRVRIAIKKDHRQYGNMYYMVAAPPVSGKTPVIRPAVAPLVELQQERYEEWKEAHRQWKAQEKITLARISGLENKAKNAADSNTRNDLKTEIINLQREIGEEPMEPCLFCEDATSEALARRMVANGGCIGSLSGEGRKVIAIARGRYVEGGDIDLWLKGHGGDFARIDRASRPAITIQNAVLSACIMTQPDSLQELGEESALRESGFLARWIYLVPESIGGDYPTENIPEYTKRNYVATIRALAEMPLVKDADGKLCPRLVEMEPQAFVLWQELHNTIKQRIREGGETMLPFMRDWLGKQPEHIARLALLLNVVRTLSANDPLGSVQVEDIEAADKLSRVFEAHAVRAAGLVGESDAVTRARKAWRWIHRNRARLVELREKDGTGKIEAVKPRDLQRDNVAGLDTGDAARATLDVLVDRGYLQCIEFQKSGSGKSTQLYYIRPKDLTPPDKPDKTDIDGYLSGKSGLSGTPLPKNTDTPEPNREMPDTPDKTDTTSSGAAENGVEKW